MTKFYEIWRDKEGSKALFPEDSTSYEEWTGGGELLHRFEAADWECAKVIQNYLLGLEPYQSDYRRYGGESLRGGGRTTRMLREAIHSSLKKGDGVIHIIVDRESRVSSIRSFLEREATRLSGGGNSGEIFSRIERIRVETVGSLGCFNWEELTWPGRSEGDEVFIDHYAIESRFKKLLGHLHRWDSSDVKGVKG